MKPTPAIALSALFVLIASTAFTAQRDEEHERTFLVYALRTPRVGRVEGALLSLPGWYIVRAHRVRPLEDGIVFAIEDVPIFAHAPEWSRQWGIHNDGSYTMVWPVCMERDVVEGADSNVLPAWEITEGEGAVVAVMDTGVDSTHPELQGKVIDAVSFVLGEDEGDGNGHGTHVAGIIAASKNDIEPIGVFPQASIISVKVLNKEGYGYLSGIARGFDYIIQRAREGVPIGAINASWGGIVPREEVLPLVRDILLQLKELNIPLVTSAGNNGTQVVPSSFPCSFNDISPVVICVGAFSPNGRRSCFSNCSSKYVNISAPGEDILSVLPHGEKAFWSGTSMAAPFVSATAAVLRQRVDTVEDVAGILRRSSIPWAFFPKRPVGDEAESLTDDVSLIVKNPSPCESTTEWSSWGVLDVATALAFARR